MDLARRLYNHTSEISGSTQMSPEVKPREDNLAIEVYRPDVSAVSLYHPAMSDSHTGKCANIEVEQVFRHGDRLAD